MSFAKMFAAATLLVSAVMISAQEPAVMKLVRKNYDGSTTINSQFDLTIYWSVREKEERKSGELFLSPGEKFRVNLGKETFVSDGKTYWQYSEKNNQLVIRNLGDIDLSMQPSHLLSTFLSGRTFTQKSSKDGVVQLEWIGNPEESDDYRSVSVSIEEKSGIVKTLKLIDKNENINTYTFKKTVLGKSLPKDAFRFTPPKGTEVHDLRETDAPN